MSGYADLQREKSNAESQLSSTVSENQTLAEQIERLKSAKSIVSEEKSNFSSIKGRVRTIIDGSYEWKGQSFDNFVRDGDNLNTENTSYYYAVDDALDAINDKITELENRIYSNDGLIGWLRSRINDLWNAIENFFN